MSQSLIRLENVTKYYNGEGGVGLGIHKVNLSFKIGEFVIITGSSGSGKTTLLNVISGMDTYEEGTIYVNGEDTSYYGNSEYEDYRRNYISFIFQNYNLIESFNVLQNVELALIARGFSKKERHEKALEIIKEVGLEKRINNRVTKLSGGEKQRVAIARALASDAPIVVCDEITGNLDSTTSIEIIELLRKVSTNKLVLLVSHDPEEAIKYATRIITMHDGSIDKDYETDHKPTNCEVKIAPSKKISFLELVKLSLRNINSTPKKFIFMLLILFVSAFLFTYVIALYQELKGTVVDSLYGIQSGIGSYEERIVVKKKDNSTFTEAEINNFSNLKNVKNVSLYNKALNQNVIIEYENEYFANYYNIRDVSDLNKEDLTMGRLPENSDEVIIQAQSISKKDQKGLGVYLNMTCNNIPYKIKVVGIIETYNSYDNFIYLSSIMLNEIEKAAYISNLDFEITYPEGTSLDYIKNGNNYYLPEKFEYVGSSIDNSLLDNVIQYRIYYYDDEKGYIKYEDGYLSSNYNLTFKASNYYEQHLLNNCKLSIKTVAYSSTDYYKNDEIVMNENTYNLIKSNGAYQVSITTNNKANNSKIVDTLEKEGYFCYSYEVKSTDQFVESMAYIVSAIEAYVVFYFVIFIVVIVILTFVILRNTMKSQQKNFLIMRSLGIDGKKIKIQVYMEMVIMSIFAIVLVIGIWAICNIKRFNAFTNVIANLSLGMLMFSSLIIILMAFYIAFRYTIGVLHTAIVSKEME